MRLLIAWSVAVVLALLAALHLYWGAGGHKGSLAAIPEREGKPLFTPGPLACVAVALLLSLAGLFGLGAVGVLDLRALPQPLMRAGAGLAGAVLLLRAVGDFRWVGFFKRRTGTRFAALDDRVYSPLCLALGAGLLACAASP